MCHLFLLSIVVVVDNKLLFFCALPITHSNVYYQSWPTFKITEHKIALKANCIQNARMSLKLYKICHFTQV